MNIDSDSCIFVYLEVHHLIKVKYEGTFPKNRAISPILFVGDFPVVEVELINDNYIQF